MHCSDVFVLLERLLQPQVYLLFLGGARIFFVHKYCVRFIFEVHTYAVPYHFLGDIMLVNIMYILLRASANHMPNLCINNNATFATLGYHFSIYVVEVHIKVRNTSNNCGKFIFRLLQK